MSVFSRLYTGTGAFDIVGRRKTWYVAFGLLVLICVASIVFRGFNLGIDFTGGTQIQFPANTATAPATAPAVQEVFQKAIDIEPASVQTAGTGPAAVVLIRSETLSLAQTVTVKQALFDAFGPRGADGVPSPNVISISAVSGELGRPDHPAGAHRARRVPRAGHAVPGVLLRAGDGGGGAGGAGPRRRRHMGVYSIVGFEVTPATVIGLLTILGFSLYDTVVVFDKVKENTRGLLGLTRRTYAEAANLALNQTLMRSINTSLIAVLPVVGLLIVGVGVLGVGTLADLALVQLVGILAGALSSLLLATPLLVDLKMRDRRFQEQAARVLVPAAARQVVGRGARRARRRGGRGARPVRRRRARPAAAAGAGGRGGREHPEPRGQGRAHAAGRGPAHRQGVEAHRQAAPVTEPEEPDLDPSPGPRPRRPGLPVSPACCSATSRRCWPTPRRSRPWPRSWRRRWARPTSSSASRRAGFLLGAAAALVAGTGVVPVRKAGKEACAEGGRERCDDIHVRREPLEFSCDFRGCAGRLVGLTDVTRQGRVQVHETLSDGRIRLLNCSSMSLAPFSNALNTRSAVKFPSSPSFLRAPVVTPISCAMVSQWAERLRRC